MRIKLIYVLVLVFPTLIFSQKIITFTTDNTFTVPAGVTQITVEAWGAGGGGSDFYVFSQYNNKSGGGGGGGGFSGGVLNVMPGDIITITIGKGGSGGSVNVSGVDGGNTTVSHTSGEIIANGGLGAVFNSLYGGNGGGGSFSGVVTSKINYDGGNGGRGDWNSGGSGGGAAGNISDGANGQIYPSTGGDGGVENGNGGTGNGGDGGNSTSGIGENGYLYGGGGGGSHKNGGGGGDGAQGLVLLKYYGPSISVTGKSIFIANEDTTPSTDDDTDFGTHGLNSSVSKIYTIHNLGTLDLILNNNSSPYVSISGTNAANFIVDLSATSGTISPGSSTTFKVTFSTTTIGEKTALIQISNNDIDTDKTLFTFNIMGEGVQNFFDSDGDGIFDNDDIDDDNDGIKDIDEELSCRLSTVASTTNYKFLNETFGAGENRVEINTTYDAETSYCYEDGTGTACKGESWHGDDLNDGEYTVYYKAANGDGNDDTPNGEIAHWADQYWYTGEDHTPDDINGRMALFNANKQTGLFYTATIIGALPKVPITYSFWILNLDTEDAPNIGSRFRPDILVEFRDVNGNLLESILTSDDYPTGIPPSINGDASNSWYQFTEDLIFDVDEFYVYFYNNEFGGEGNDLAIDDIVISQTLCDMDSDGVADVFDLDSDNDGIPDVVEAGLGHLSEGTAKISYTNGWVDDNGDGMHDTAFNNSLLDSDGDGVPNYIDLDSDNDGVFDVDESGATNPLAYVGYQNGDGDINGDGVGDGLDTDAVRVTDVDSDGTQEYFTDGILDIYDYYNGVTFDTAYGNVNQGEGNTYYVLDTDGDGVPDYMDITSNGGNDFDTTIYKQIQSTIDSDNDGVIDGATDIDGDGILDSFDTDNTVFGSPRDIDDKLLLYFDGRNDYVEDAAILSGEASIMGWIKIESVPIGTQRILGQNNFYIQIDSSKKIAVVANNTVQEYDMAIDVNRWVHIAATYSSSHFKLYINGVELGNGISGGTLSADTSSFTMGRISDSDDGYFKGYIDEVRVFSKALTENELQKIVYQEVEDNSGVVKGSVVQLNVEDYSCDSASGVETSVDLSWSNLLRYYRMDTYKDDITDDLSTTAIDVVSGAKMYNMKVIDVQTAPLPFVTQISGTESTPISLSNALNTSEGVNGTDAITSPASIVKIVHNNIYSDQDQEHVALFIWENNTYTMNGVTDIDVGTGTGSKLEISWYLYLNGTIDLNGESQLVQGMGSILDTSSSGSIERDQQGTENSFNYNYWSSPVGPTGSDNNANYTLGDYTMNTGVLYDGSKADGTTEGAEAYPLKINFKWPYTSADNATAPTPIVISSYWLFKFYGTAGEYNSWESIIETTELTPGEGFTMKGTDGDASISGDFQNLVFKGKPYNGTIKLPIINSDGIEKNRLIGNPYPSAIDGRQFILDNLSTSNGGTNAAGNIFNGALYFWDHFGQEDSHVLKEYVGGYATYNLTTGVAAISNDSRINDNDACGDKIPGRYIPVGQGFFVITALGNFKDENGDALVTIDGGDIVFKNGQRVFKKESDNDVSGDPVSVFMKTTNTKSSTALNEEAVQEEETPVVRLMFDSPTGYHRQIAIGAIENTTNNFDLGYDAFIAGIGTEDMYWTLQDAKLVIQGVPNFNDDQEFPLALKISETGLATIKIDALKNIDENVELFIKDNTTLRFYKINEQPFEMNLEAGEYLNRFSLTFKSHNKEEEIIEEEGEVVEVIAAANLTVFMDNNAGELQIRNTTNSEILEVKLFNSLGQLMGAWNQYLNKSYKALPVNIKVTGMYIVQLKTTAGVITKKVLIE